jgi:hypothetical protein
MLNRCACCYKFKKPKYTKHYRASLFEEKKIFQFVEKSHKFYETRLMILFILHSEYLKKEAHEGFGNFKIRGQVLRTLKYVDDLVLMAKEDVIL